MMITNIGDIFLLKTILNKKYPAIINTNIFINTNDGAMLNPPSKLIGNKTSLSKIKADEQINAIATNLTPLKVA